MQPNDTFLLSKFIACGVGFEAPERAQNPNVCVRSQAVVMTPLKTCSPGDRSRARFLFLVIPRRSRSSQEADMALDQCQSGLNGEGKGSQS